MRYFASLIENIKPTLSGHDTFSLKYGWLKKVYDQINDLSDDNESSNVFSADSAIADFGVGKNMLNAMRFWSTHTAMIYRQTNAYYNTDEKFASEYVLTKNNSIDALQQINHFYNAESLLDDEGLDPYLESPSTIWLLHLCLVTNPNLVTYYWFFNINNKQELTKQEFMRLLKEFLDSYNLDAPADKTISNDISCFILNYSSKRRKANDNFEATLEGPLVELGLLSRVNNQGIRALRGEKNSLSLHVFMYALINCWKIHGSTADTLSLEIATYDECSPGRVFMLDEEAIIGYAEQLSESGYSMIWTQSAGIRQFQLINGSKLQDILDQSIERMKAEDYNRQ